MASTTASSHGRHAEDQARDVPGEANGVREKIAAKQAEANKLRERIQQAKLCEHQLRIRLTTFGIDPSLVPQGMEAGGCPGSIGGCATGITSEATQRRELRSLLLWLAECVDLSQQVTFECAGRQSTITVGGRGVLLHRMVAWQLSASEGSFATAAAENPTRALKLSVPVDLQAEIRSMVLAVKRKGMADSELHRLAEAWEIVGAEVLSAAVGSPEPAIFLVHRQLAHAMVVAQWPAVEFARKVSTGGKGGGPPSHPFDPDLHFGWLAAAAGSAAVPPVGASEPRK